MSWFYLDGLPPQAISASEGGEYSGIYFSNVSYFQLLMFSKNLPIKHQGSAEIQPSGSPKLTI